MTELITRAGAWLVQQAAALPDTVVMIPVPAERGWFETVTGIASSVMTLTLLVLSAFLAPAAWSFWRTFRKVRGLLDRVYADVTPLTHHASNIADNLDYITSSIRHDVQQVNATIASANRRLQQAADVTEQRINEFNALLKVAQQEAEQAFVSTAAAVRGVRTGAATLGSDEDDASELAEVNGGSEDGNDESDGWTQQVDSGSGRPRRERDRGKKPATRPRNGKPATRPRNGPARRRG